MRVLVTGAEGMLGRAFAESRPADAEYVATDVTDCDIRDAAAVARALDDARAEALVNLAAYTAVDACEEHEEDALAVNGTAVGVLGAACAERSIPMLHVSTDYVFDGELASPALYDEDARVAPLSAYGRTKLAGERALRAATDAHWIVRTQWLYGLGGPNFVETMLRLASERERLAVVDDQVGSPTSVDDLAPVLWALVLRGAPYGTYHATNAGECSWFAFARAIFEREGVDVVLEPTDSQAFVRPARRPARSVLDNTKLRRVLGASPPPWEEALDRYLKRRAAAGRVA